MASVKSNYIYNTINTISGMLFPLITFPYVARVLMPEGIGLVNFYAGIITYITMISSLGIPVYAIREISKARNDKRSLAMVVTEILSLNFILTAISYIIVLILSLTIHEIRENLNLFLLMSTNILFVTIGCEWFYQGMEDFRYITIRGLVIKCICVVLLFILVRSKDDLIYYGLYSVIGVVGGNVWNFIRLRKYISYKEIVIRKLRPLSHLKKVSKFFIIAVIGSIYLQLDVVMLGFLSGNASVGYYSGALRLTKMVMGIVTSLGIVLLPRLSVLNNTDKRNFDLLLTKSYNLVILLALPMVFGLIVISKPLIIFFCGSQFYPSIPVLIILAPIILFIGITYISAQCMIAKGNENIPIYAGLMGAIVNLGLNFLLIPIYSEIGAAISTFVTEGAILIFYIALAIKNNSIPSISRNLLSCLLGCFIMSVAIIFIVRSSLDLVVVLCICPIIGCIVYMISLYMLKNEYFIDLITDIKLKIHNQ